MRNLRRFLAAAIVTLSAASAAACPTDDRIVFVSCQTPVKAQLKRLGRDPVSEGPRNSLTITGTYSSADRFGIEGIAIVAGKLVSGRFKGWDGLAVISPDGGLSLHHVERVALGGQRFNLRDRDARRGFEALARKDKLSAIQSHLLIADGAVDVQDRAGQPQFRRRILFETRDGNIGVFDTGGRALTLFAAARELEAAVGPRMALNLDMGAYDYCAWNRGGPDYCGLLPRSATGILTNVLIFSFPPPQ